VLTQSGSTTTRNESYPATSNRIVDVTTNSTLTHSFTYDNAGNIATDTQGSDVTAYGYNARNRLATVTKNGSLWATYQYNALEQLVSRTVTAPAGPTGTVQYVYDQQGQLVAEADAATGATVREYIWLDDMPVAVVTDIAALTLTIYFVHVDHLKRPVAMSDAAKAMVWQAKWLPFGTASSITGTASLDARFPGQWFQIESGLHYNWHRHYDPSIGRYTQPDPLRFVDGPSVFAYAGSTPLMTSDTTGRQMEPEQRGFSDLLKGLGIIKGPLWCTPGEDDPTFPPYMNQEKDPSTPTGRRGNPIEVEPGTSQPTNIGGRDYTGHALDRMQGRGVPPSAVEDAIDNGSSVPGRNPGTTVHTGNNGVTVVTGSGGRVITVITK